jgi:hypothetical protein
VATVYPPHAELHTAPHPSLAIPATAPKTQQLLSLRHPFRLQTLASLWHLTSLDAPTVAVTWMLAFAWAVDIHLPLWLPATLALSAWTFYVADRLMDARSGTRQAVPSSLTPVHSSLRPRHLYHWQHRRIFLPLAILSALAALALVLHYMPFPARERNSVLGAATLAYFASVHTPTRRLLPIRFKLPKELLVGILFTLACVLPVAMRIAASTRAALILPTLAFMALAWLNCHAIESWESELPKAAPGKIQRLGFALATLSAAAAVLALWLTSSLLPWPRITLLLTAAALSAALLALLDRRRPQNPTTLRAAADLALLTPLLLLLL